MVQQASPLLKWRPDHSASRRKQEVQQQDAAAAQTDEEAAAEFTPQKVYQTRQLLPEPEMQEPPAPMELIDLNPSQLARLEFMFSHMDSSGNGMLEVGELQRLLGNEWDPDCDSGATLDLQNWILAVRASIGAMAAAAGCDVDSMLWQMTLQLFTGLSPLQMERGENLFKRVDANDDGFLELCELKGFFASAFDDEFLEQVRRVLQLDRGDGMLSANGWHLLLQNMKSHYDEATLDRFLAYRELGNEIVDNVPLCDEVISGRKLVQGAGEESAEPKRKELEWTDLQEEELEGYLRELFSIADTNGDGVLQADEFSKLMELSGIFPDGIDAECFSRADTNQDGVLDQEELLAVFKEMQNTNQAAKASAMAELCAVQEAEDKAVEAEKAAVVVDQATKAVEEAQASGDQAALEAAYQALEEAEAAQCEAEEKCEAAEAKVAQTGHSEASKQQVIEQASSEGSARKQAASDHQDCCPSKQAEPKSCSSGDAADTSKDAAADATAKPAAKSGEELAQCHPELAAAVSEVLLALPGVGRNMLRMHVAPEHPQVFQMTGKEMDAITGFVKSQMAEQLDALSMRDQERSLEEVGMQPEDLCEIERQTQELLQQKYGHNTFVSVRSGYSKVSWDGSTRCEGLHVRVTYDRCEEGREDEVKTDTCVFYVKRPHQYDWVDDQESQTWTIEPIKTSSESPAH